MQTQLLDPARNPAAVETAARLLQAGEVVGLPTETVYGLGANALNRAAVRKIFQAKGRPQDNPLIVHIAEFSQIKPLVSQIPAAAKRLAEAFWPGPLTMILPKSDAIPDEVSAGLPSVGIRMPAHPVAQAILRAAGLPIAAPSANRSGKPSTTTARHVLEDMDGSIAAVVDGGPCRVGVESTVISLVTTPPRLLRPGGISLEQLRAVLGEVAVDKALYESIADTESVSAPGMKYRHYAPKAPVTVLSGRPDLTARYIRTHADEETGVLCFDEFRNRFPKGAVRSFGSFADPAEQARQVFDALRAFDRLPVTRIYAQCPEDSGVGLAVSNRLKKAAGFQVIPLPELAVVGLTGGSGCGKTLVSQLLEPKGIPTVNADTIYHTLLDTDPDLRSALRRAFGGGIFDQAGQLQRKALGSIVFSDPEKLHILSELTTPFIRQASFAAFNRLAKQRYSLCLYDAPTLFETGFDRFCTYTVSVLAPKELRIARIQQRDKVSYAYAAARVHAQPADAFYKTRSQFLLENGESQDKLRHHVMEFYKTIMAQE